MNLDMRTLLAITGLLTSVMTVYIIVLWLIHRKKTKGIGIAIFGIGFFSLGSLFTAIRGITSDFLSIVIGNTLVILGISLFHLSIRMFLEMDRKNAVQRFLYILTAAISVEQYLFGIIWPNLNIRAISVSFAVTVCYVCMIMLFYKERKKWAAAGYFMLVLFSILAISATIRIPVILINPADGNFLNMQGYHPVAIAIHALCMSSWPVGFAMLISEKLKRVAQKANEQNILLLQELAHRTKNNMSLILSLIAWQKNALPRKECYSLEEIQNSLKIVENRILSMSIVHKQLFLSDDLSSIPLESYIEELASSIHDSFTDSSERISVEMELDHIEFSIDSAIHIGLILNELLTNSYKHAFNDREQGIITIKIIGEKDDSFTFEYYDNGKGCSGEQLKTSAGIGMQMIHSLGEQQLRGSLTLKPGPGFGCILSIPNPEK